MASRLVHTTRTGQVTAEEHADRVWRIALAPRPPVPVHISEALYPVTLCGLDWGNQDWSEPQRYDVVIVPTDAVNCQECLDAHATDTWHEGDLWAEDTVWNDDVVNVHHLEDAS